MSIELKAGTDFIIAIDVSSSMLVNDCPGSLSRFDFAMEKTREFCRQADKVDADGISLFTFGHQVMRYMNVTLETVNGIIDGLQANQCATLTDTLIQSAYAEHVANGNDATLLFIVTDGSPTHPGAVMEQIKLIANDLIDPKSFRITFLTVGDIDVNLRKFLTQLDDSIPGAKADIVDVKALADVDFYAAVDGALND